MPTVGTKLALPSERACKIELDRNSSSILGFYFALGDLGLLKDVNSEVMFEITS